MPEYLNPHTHDLNLPDEHGRIIKIKRGQHIQLPLFFDRYVSTRGLRRVNTPASQQHHRVRRLPVRPKPNVKPVSTKSTIPARSTKVVGSGLNKDVSELFGALLQTTSYPISNGIGVGILSYNRPTSLRRLIDSILRYTNINTTTIIVSDDGSTDADLIQYLGHLQADNRIIILKNKERAGIAGNSNRLLRCLERFTHKLLLNDDIEILKEGWDRLYFNKMNASGLHHMCLRQPGVYGAAAGTPIIINNTQLLRTDEKPHGAVLALDTKAFDTVGYFNQDFGLYGMEHVDWSTRVGRSNIQPVGFYDVPESTSYFKLHAEKSAVEHRVELLQQARRKYEELKHGPIHISCPAMDIPTIKCVIPFRDTSRTNAILAVANNIRAQRWPCIDIVLTEQDYEAKFAQSMVYPLRYVFVGTPTRTSFNKSMAFNAGIASLNAKDDDIIILHDADTLAPSQYFPAVNASLQHKDACHLCEKVYYANESSTDRITRSGTVANVTCNRLVNYFEGGSLACKHKTYWEVGAFDESFVGYGCFLPGNVVLTDTGYQNIENVQDDSLLYTSEFRFKRCKIKSRQYDGEVYNIFVAGKPPIIGVTPEHPFLVKSGDELAWKPVAELKSGDLVATTSDIIEKYIFWPINNIRHYPYAGIVYNFEVEDDQSYVVNGLVVHNCEDTDFYARLSSISGWDNSRRFVLLHLHHGRSQGWMNDFNRNKEQERQLKLLPMSQRISRQINWLKTSKYSHMVKQ